MATTVKPCEEWIRWDGNVESKLIEHFKVLCATCNSDYVTVEVSFSPDSPPHCAVLLHCPDCLTTEVIFNVVDEALP
jgi:hypothetical protein